MQDNAWKLPAQTELLLFRCIQGAGYSGIYGLDIQRAFSECSGGSEGISHGSLYSTLKRLREKGFVDSRQGNPVGGGAYRQYYYLTEDGREALEAFDGFIIRLKSWGRWQGVGLGGD